MVERERGASFVFPHGGRGLGLQRKTRQTTISAKDASPPPRPTRPADTARGRREGERWVAGMPLRLTSDAPRPEADPWKKRTRGREAGSATCFPPSELRRPDAHFVRLLVRALRRSSWCVRERIGPGVRCRSVPHAAPFSSTPAAGGARGCPALTLHEDGLPASPRRLPEITRLPRDGVFGRQRTRAIPTCPRWPWETRPSSRGAAVR